MRPVVADVWLLHRVTPMRLMAHVIAAIVGKDERPFLFTLMNLFSV